MIKKTIFEIPIYSMRKEVFDDRWNQKLLSESKYTPSLVPTIKSIYFPQYIWKYNQIIGYIIISVTKDSVWFDIHLSIKQKIRYDSSKKPLIYDTCSNGTHFYAHNLENKEIRAEIMKWLQSIENDFLKKTFFVDYSSFNNIINHVDIKSIMITP